MTTCLKTVAVFLAFLLLAGEVRADPPARPRAPRTLRLPATPYHYADPELPAHFKTAAALRFDNTPTDNLLTIADPVSRTQIETLRRNCEEFKIRLHPLGKVGRHAFAKIAAADDEIYLRIESGQEHRCLAGRISCSDHVQWPFVAQKRFNMRRGKVDTGTAELA